MSTNTGDEGKLAPIMQPKPQELKPLLKDVPNGQFVKKHLELFSEPFATIYVGSSDEAPEKEKQKFTLPKNLISYYFNDFEVAFNGSFREAENFEIHLEECSIETFKLVIHWCYNGQITLDDIAGEKNAQTIDRLLGFLVFAGYAEINTSVDSVLLQIKNILTEDEQALQPKHIRTAIAKFPSMTTRPVPEGRKLFTSAAMQPWALRQDQSECVKYKSRVPPFAFKFRREVNQLEGFTSDLFKVLGESNSSGMRDLVLGVATEAGNRWSLLRSWS